MLENLEQALVDRMKATAKARNLNVKVDSYGGQLDDDLLEGLVRMAPAAFLVVSGLDKSRKLTRGVELKVKFSVLVAATSLDGGRARCGGRSGRVVGAYSLADFANDALSGFRVDPLQTPLQLEGVQNLFSQKIHREFLAIYGVQFTALVHWLREPVSGLEDLTLIHAKSTPAGAAKDSAPVESSMKQKP